MTVFESVRMDNVQDFIDDQDYSSSDSEGSDDELETVTPAAPSGSSTEDEIDRGEYHSLSLYLSCLPSVNDPERTTLGSTAGN